MGTCRYCNQNAGFLRKQHGPCRDLHTQGIQEMTQLAAQADRNLPSVITGSTTLDRASADRITGLARSAALAHGGGGTLQELDNALRRTSMSNTHRGQLLIRAWETAIEGAIENRVISLDQDAVICGVAQHIAPQPQNIIGGTPSTS